MTEQRAIEVLEYSKGYDGMDCGAPRIALDMAIQALEENQQYHAIEKKLADMFGGELPLAKYVDELEAVLEELDNPHPMNAKILTYEDAAMWDAYRAIGTVEEFKALKAQDTDCILKHLIGYCSYNETGCSGCKGKIAIKTALEKAESKKPILRKDGTYDCICGNGVIKTQFYCEDCGQKLDLEDEEKQKNDEIITDSDNSTRLKVNWDNFIIGEAELECETIEDAELLLNVCKENNIFCDCITADYFQREPYWYVKDGMLEMTKYVLDDDSICSLWTVQQFVEEHTV